MGERVACYSPCPFLAIDTVIVPLNVVASGDRMESPEIRFKVYQFLSANISPQSRSECSSETMIGIGQLALDAPAHFSKPHPSSSPDRLTAEKSYYSSNCNRKSCLATAERNFELKVQDTYFSQFVGLV